MGQEWFRDLKNGSNQVEIINVPQTGFEHNVIKWGIPLRSNQYLRSPILYLQRMNREKSVNDLSTLCYVIILPPTLSSYPWPYIQNKQIHMNSTGKVLQTNRFATNSLSMFLLFFLFRPGRLPNRNNYPTRQWRRMAKSFHILFAGGKLLTYWKLLD